MGPPPTGAVAAAADPGEAIVLALPVEPGAVARPAEAAPVAAAPGAERPVGIGGWLLLPAIGLCLSPVTTVLTVARDHVPLFVDGTLAAVSLEGGPRYEPLLGPLIVTEAVVNSALAIFIVVVAFYFFTRRAVAPKLMISLYLVRLAFMVIDDVLGSQIESVAEVKGGTGMGQSIGAAIQAAIWVPYFLSSRRVKNTFTR